MTRETTEQNAEKALELYSLNPPSYIGDSYFLVGYINYYLNNESEMLKYFELAKQSYLENNLHDLWKHKEDNKQALTVFKYYILFLYSLM